MTEQKPTHAVTKPNQPPATPLAVLKTDLYKDVGKVAVYYGGSKEEADRFILASLEYVRRIPKLLDCDRQSLLMAFLQSAQFRFMPVGTSGEAYIIPYGREAKFQFGYQGIVTLLYRSGKVKSISSNVIFENDIFEYEEGMEARLKHVPAFGKPRGEAIGVYTIAEMVGGGKTFKVMDKDAIMAIKNLSKAKATADSPWNSDKDPEKWMWRKTCLLQHAKLLPKTRELQQAIEIDYEGEGMEKPRLDAGGPAVGGSSHRPTEPIHEASAVELSGKKCKAGAHPVEHTDADGDCADCVSEALSGNPAPEGEGVIEA